MLLICLSLLYGGPLIIFRPRRQIDKILCIDLFDSINEDIQDQKTMRGTLYLSEVTEQVRWGWDELGEGGGVFVHQKNIKRQIVVEELVTAIMKAEKKLFWIAVRRGGGVGYIIFGKVLLHRS